MKYHAQPAFKQKKEKRIIALRAGLSGVALFGTIGRKRPHVKPLRPERWCADLGRLGATKRANFPPQGLRQAEKMRRHKTARVFRRLWCANR
jgi:hypothetical protein